MEGWLAHAEGSPCPTLALDATRLPRAEAALLDALAAARAQLVAAGRGELLKLALIARSARPGFGLDYRFVQCLPGSPDRFDLNGTCGHSILAAVLAAHAWGWLPRLAPGDGVRVAVAKGDDVACEVTAADGGEVEFTTRFLPAVARLGALLPTGVPRTRLGVGRTGPSASLVAAGNPYAFVDAAELGATTRALLFADDDALYAELAALRERAAVVLGLPAGGAFPKVAAVGQFEPGRLAVRALAVPTWHPTLALTGTVSLGVSSAISGTVPFRLACRAGCRPGALTIDTPGGVTAVDAAVTGSTHEDRLLSTSVHAKRARAIGPIAVPGADDDGAHARRRRSARDRRIERRTAGAAHRRMPTADTHRDRSLT